MMPVYEEDAPTQLGGYIERWCRFATEGELGIEEFHQRYLSALLSAQGAWFQHLNALYCALLLMGHAWMEGAAS
jgi:hypothetical protein